MLPEGMAAESAYRAHMLGRAAWPRPSNENRIPNPLQFEALNLVPCTHITLILLQFNGN